MERVKLERINIDITFPEDFEIEKDSVPKIKEELENIVDTKLRDNGITRFSKSSISEQKHRAEVLYLEESYRVITTKSCKALLQVKHKYDKKDMKGFYWKDHAWFSDGTDENSLKTAMKEIDRLKGKRKTGKRGTARKDKYLKNIPKGDKELLASLLG